MVFGWLTISRSNLGTKHTLLAIDERPTASEGGQGIRPKRRSCVAPAPIGAVSCIRMTMAHTRRSPIAFGNPTAEGWRIAPAIGARQRRLVRRMYARVWHFSKYKLIINSDVQQTTILR